MEIQIVLFLILLPVVAFLYCSVGHGGASGYLALMSLFAFATGDMKVIALVLNLFVSGIGFYLFWKRGFFRKELFIPFALGSIPASFLGGLIELDAYWYKKVLAILLLIAILRMMNVFGKSKENTQSISLFPAILIGVLIGFLSGLIGIGGGIVLSPIILLLGWGKMKETAAVSALFIFVNSAAGLLGNLWNKSSGLDYTIMIWMIGLAIAGGYLGGKWGSGKVTNENLTRVLALVLLIAAVKLAITPA